jgi:DNA repair protein RadC
MEMLSRTSSTRCCLDHQIIGDLIGLPANKVRETLARYDLRSLGSMTEHELLEAGLTPARARRLHSALQLAQRLGNGKPLQRGQPFTSPRQIFDAYHLRFRDEKREHFLVVTLDARHRVMREHVISIGSLTSSIVHPREVFRPAIREAAGAMLFVHNHPSGDPQPSDEDVAVTRRLVHASELLGIRVLDHVIVGDGRYASFKETGIL